MQARLREEQQRSHGWLEHFRRPMLSLAAALGLVIGIGVIQMDRFLEQPQDPPPYIGAGMIKAPTGTAVSDLQYLDKNSDWLQNFTALDDMDGDADMSSSN
jgi:hypothetical protein